MITENKKKSTSDNIIEIAKQRFQLAVDAEKRIRDEALEDLKFRAGEQWPDDVKISRDQDRRPCLTINRLPQFIRQITNDQRQNRPSIKVSPVDDSADVETAKVLQGMIRHIEYNSNADIAYDTAFEGAATHGFGYFRILTDYVDPRSFDQEILIKRIRNPFSVYLDPNYQEPDGSDAMWGFIFERITKDEYKEQYKDTEMASMLDWASVGDHAPDWADKDSCRIAEYFYKETKDVTIYLLSDKTVVEDLPDVLPDGVYVVDKRETCIPVVKWCKLNAIEVLEETEWLGSWIPIIPVLGDELDIDGEKRLEGVIRHAKDPQRMYNYWASSETEMITLAPKAPWIMAEGQDEGFEYQWETANTKNHSTLKYKPTLLDNGKMAPPPQRNFGEPAVAAITNARMQSAEELKSTTGIYDAGLGNRSNESSGVAIQRRANQSQTTNFHLIDNLARSIKHAGRIIVELIPKIYDTERAITIIGEDDEKELVYINKVFEKNGKAIKYDLSSGKYDVTISQGPNYATKRQEAVDSMLSLVSSMPQVGQFITDLLVKNMDWPGSEEFSERLKRTIPPEILGDDGNEQGEELPPQVANQLKMLSEQNNQLTQALNQANDEIDKKRQELDYKAQIEREKLNYQYAKLEADMRIELLKQDAADSRFAFEQEINQIDRKQRINEASQNSGMASQPLNPTGGQSPGTPME